MSSTDDAIDTPVVEPKDAKEKILRFLTKLRSHTENEGTIRVQLLYNGPTQDKLVDAFPYTFDDVQTTAEDILKKVLDHAENCPSGKVKYTLQGRINVTTHTQVFSVNVQAEGEDDYELEPPNDEGREAQRMKYTLQLQKQSLDTTKVAIRASQMPIDVLSHQLEKAEAKIEKLEARLEKEAELRNQLLDGQQARDIAFDEYRQKKVLQQKAAKSLGPAVKMLVAHVAGAPPEVIQQMMRQMISSAGSEGASSRDPGDEAPAAASNDARPSYEDLLKVFRMVGRLFSGPDALTEGQVMDILPILSEKQQSNLGELHIEVLGIRERAAAGSSSQHTNGTHKNGTNGAAYAPFGGQGT